MLGSRRATRGHGGITRPYETASLRITHLGIGKKDGVGEIRQLVIRNGELALQSAIGDAAMLL